MRALLLFTLLALSACGQKDQPPDTCPLVVKPDKTWVCAEQRKCL